MGSGHVGPHTCVRDPRSDPINLVFLAMLLKRWRSWARQGTKKMGAAALVPWALSGKAKTTEASSLGGISKHEAVATRVDW